MGFNGNRGRVRATRDERISFSTIGSRVRLIRGGKNIAPVARKTELRGIVA